MKKVTVYLEDETVDILNELAQLQEFYKYPIYQAYGLLIDEIVRDFSIVVRQAK